MTLFINTLLNRSKKRISYLYSEIEKELRYYQALKKEYDEKYPNYPLPTISSSEGNQILNSSNQTPNKITVETPLTTPLPPKNEVEKKQTMVERMRVAREKRIANLAQKKLEKEQKTNPETFNMTI